MSTMTGTTAAQAATSASPAARAMHDEARQAKPLPAPNSDFYQLADVLTAEERAIVKKVRHEGPAHHQQVLVRRCVSVRIAALI
jgi:hypothetical protein